MASLRATALALSGVLLSSIALANPETTIVGGDSAEVRARAPVAAPAQDNIVIQDPNTQAVEEASGSVIDSVYGSGRYQFTLRDQGPTTVHGHSFPGRFGVGLDSNRLKLEAVVTPGFGTVTTSGENGVTEDREYRTVGVGPNVRATYGSVHVEAEGTYTRRDAEAFARGLKTDSLDGSLDAAVDVGPFSVVASAGGRTTLSVDKNEGNERELTARYVSGGLAANLTNNVGLNARVIDHKSGLTDTRATYGQAGVAYRTGRAVVTGTALVGQSFGVGVNVNAPVSQDSRTRVLVGAAGYSERGINNGPRDNRLLATLGLSFE